MHESKRNIKKRIDEMEGRDLKGQALEEFHILTDTYKNILKIEMLEDGGYSRDRGYSMDDDYYSMEYSERRRRDRMGRYSRDGDSYDEDEPYRRGGRGGYSRDEGMEDMKREFQRMMDNAKSPEEKLAIERCMRQLDKYEKGGISYLAFRVVWKCRVIFSCDIFEPYLTARDHKWRMERAELGLINKNNCCIAESLW